MNNRDIQPNRTFDIDENIKKAKEVYDKAMKRKEEDGSKDK